jgi:hypothetical protein
MKSNFAGVIMCLEDKGNFPFVLLVTGETTSRSNSGSYQHKWRQDLGQQAQPILLAEPVRVVGHHMILVMMLRIGLG